MPAAITATGLSKSFQVKVRDSGLAGALGALFRPKYRDVHAVRDVGFSIEQGEIVAFLGPNGAGKTTTLKMLSGLLYPTKGKVQVVGFDPWTGGSEFKRRITLVLGQRQQVVQDLPAIETFVLNRDIYDIADADYAQRLDELTQLLDLGAILDKPVRQLSLGERMKCELAAALLHRPSVLFLDEPTLGVDVTMQGRIRQFVERYNRQHGATVLLTSHYMADVTALCRRVIVIHHGSLLYGGDLTALTDRIAPFKLIEIDLEDSESAERAGRYAEVVERQDSKVKLRIPRAKSSATVARLLSD